MHVFESVESVLLTPPSGIRSHLLHYHHNLQNRVLCSLGTQGNPVGSAVVKEARASTPCRLLSCWRTASLACEHNALQQRCELQTSILRRQRQQTCRLHVRGQQQVGCSTVQLTASKLRLRMDTTQLSIPVGRTPVQSPVQSPVLTTCQQCSTMTSSQELVCGSLPS